MMPDMDGIELCRRLREQTSMDETVIAFLTARGRRLYTNCCALNFGGDDFIVKPIKPSLLTSRVKALLRRKKRFEVDSNGPGCHYYRRSGTGP